MMRFATMAAAASSMGRRIGRDLGDLPRQLLLAGQRRGGRVNAYFVELHVIPQLPPGAPAKASSMDS